VVVLEFASGARGIIEANDHGPPGTFTGLETVRLLQRIYGTATVLPGRS
jgi:hypothetical protein